MKKEKKSQKQYFTDYNLLIAKIYCKLNTLAAGIHKIKRKYGHDNKKC